MASKRQQQAPAAPRSEIRVGRVDLGRLMGVHPDRVSKYTGEGMPVLVRGGGGKDSIFDAIACLAWQRGKRTPGTNEQERTRYFKAQADKIEQEIRRRAGELIEAAVVETRWANMVLPMRERILGLSTLFLQRGLIKPDAEDAVIELLHEALATLAERGKEPDADAA